MKKIAVIDVEVDQDEIGSAGGILEYGEVSADDVVSQLGGNIASPAVVVDKATWDLMHETLDQAAYLLERATNRATLLEFLDGEAHDEATHVVKTVRQKLVII